MSLSSFSIKRPVFAWVLMFALIFFGALSFQSLGINENPDVDFPSIRVSYQYEGATPEVIEKDVIEPVESVLVSIQGIENMNSTAQRGSARIQLEFAIDKDIDFALQEVQSLLGRAQRQLPDQLDPPVVTKSNAADDPIMYMNLRTQNLTDRELMILFRDKIRDRLSTVEGVAEVRAFGYHEPYLRIDLNAEKMALYQLTAKDILQSIQREHSELPAGRFELGEREETVRIMGEVNKVEEFQEMLISRRGGSPNLIPLRLRDIANVYEGVENTRRISRFNGQKALGMAIQKQRGVNAAATADLVKARLDSINSDLPNGTVLGINFDRTQFIRESVNELVFTLILSALLTSFVCWLFLGSFTATINILLAIPTAIIGSFIFLNWLGFTLNTFSLLGLTLAIGVVVDDAIIMLENIVRYMQKGMDRVQASFKGAREITFAVLATTAALISVFFPIALLDSIEGKFFLEFAVTISIAVALSSLEALTLAPMRCSQFLRDEKRVTKFGKAFDASIEYLTRKYEKALKVCFNNPRKILASAFLVFAVSVFGIKYVPTEFAPAQDRGVLFVIFLAPDGSSLKYTQKKVMEFENIVKNTKGVARQFMAVGGFGGGGQSNRGNGVIILEDFKDRDQNQFDIASEIRKNIKGIEGIRIFVRDRFGGPFGGRRGSPIEFTINGPEPSMQLELFNEMKKAMEATGKIVGIRSDDALTLPEVHIIPDREKAFQKGVE
ncbi:MAG: efflux RND transporter permease subunit, partial [Bdellovibrionales bacterium]